MDLSNIKVIDKELNTLVCDNGKVFETFRRKSKGDLNYFAVLANEITNQYLNTRVTDIELINVFYEGLRKHFTDVRIEFLRKPRNSKGLKTGYIGLDIAIKLKVEMVETDEIIYAINYRKRLEELITECETKYDISIRQNNLDNLNWNYTGFFDFNVEYVCLSYRHMPDLVAKEIVEQFEDRFLDFDEEYRTKTNISVLKKPQETYYEVSIDFLLNNRHNPKIYQILEYNINWVANLLKLKPEVICGVIGRKSNIKLMLK